MKKSLSALLVVSAFAAVQPFAEGQVVISQVYGGGGNSGAPYKSDFVEIFNGGSASASIEGWSVQYASATGSGNFGNNIIAMLHGTLAPGQYYLVRGSTGTTGNSIPAPDATGTVNMSATTGKVILANVSTGVACNGGSTACSPAQLAEIVDLVGYGTGPGSTNFFEGSAAAPSLTNSTADFRKNSGCNDTNQNGSDFQSAAPAPRNTASMFFPCTAPTNPAATGSATTVTPGNTTTISGNITAGSNPASSSYTVSCDLTGVGGTNPFALTVTGTTFSGVYQVPAGTVATTWSLPCTVTDDQSRTGSFNISLTVNVPFVCGGTATAIHTIQGTGSDSPLAGQVVTVEGIVTGSFQSAKQLKGFYLQEPDATWDSDPSTSEGIFIFDNAAGIPVNIGDRVRVQGRVSEFSGSGSFLGNTLTSHLTEIGSLTDEAVCSTGNSFTRTVISLPVSSSHVTGNPSWNPDLERYEGMAVQINQRLTVTGNFSLGTFGQIDLAPSLQYAPTDAVGDATTWAAATDLVQRSVIALDDASTLSDTNLYPTLFPAGGLSDSNAIRSGDLVNYDPGTQTNSPVIGVLDDRFGEYRIQPTALPAFYSANPRPAIAPILTSVGGRFRAVSANVLNFFTTLGSRGAQTATEFQHQKTKVIEALSAMDADVYGLSEVQNFDDGNTGGQSNTYTNEALQSLVDGLNCKKAGQDALCANPPSAPYALIDTTILGNSNGTDAIRTAIIYRPDRLTTIGGPAMYYQNDTNRPALAQTFKPASGNKADQQAFTFVVNHFRSKGSACGGGLDDPFQGTCNGLRLNMAQNVITWLAGNPTGDPSASRRLLLVGDFNAYYGEDPIQYFGSHGYLNLIHAIIGNSAYSYNFGSQAGYLDHAMANSAMNLLVKRVAEWHNNADEPSSLQALNSADKSSAAQVAYYGADPWAASDHDPIVIGFNTLPGDLNDDGVVDTADQALIAGAVGKTAAQAPDRRMDYDGDGRISLNDYKLWQGYYRAWVQ